MLVSFIAAYIHITVRQKVAHERETAPSRKIADAERKTSGRLHHLLQPEDGHLAISMAIRSSGKWSFAYCNHRAVTVETPASP